MSPLDPTSFGTSTPRTTDGREYPDHLRPYEQYDAVFLPLVERLQPATFDDLTYEVENGKVGSMLPRWLASATWRGLVERRDPSMHGPRSYVLGPEARRHAA